MGDIIYATWPPIDAYSPVIFFALAMIGNPPDPSSTFVSRSRGGGGTARSWFAAVDAVATVDDDGAGTGGGSCLAEAAMVGEVIELDDILIG